MTRSICLCVLAVCATPRASFSSRDTQTFAAPPVVVISRGEYALKWTYGSHGYAFRPQLEVAGGRAVFWLPAMLHETVEPGAKGELAITDPDAMRAIDSGRVAWQESDGELVPLEIERPYDADNP